MLLWKKYFNFLNIRWNCNFSEKVMNGLRKTASQTNGRTNGRDSLGFALPCHSFNVRMFHHHQAGWTVACGSSFPSSKLSDCGCPWWACAMLWCRQWRTPSKTSWVVHVHDCLAPPCLQHRLWDHRFSWHGHTTAGDYTARDQSMVVCRAVSEGKLKICCQSIWYHISNESWPCHCAEAVQHRQQ